MPLNVIGKEVSVRQIEETRHDVAVDLGISGWCRVVWITVL